VKHEHPACCGSGLLLESCNFSLGKAGREVGWGRAANFPARSTTAWERKCKKKSRQITEQH